MNLELSITDALAIQIAEKDLEGLNESQARTLLMSLILQSMMMENLRKHVCKFHFHYGKGLEEVDRLLTLFHANPPTLEDPHCCPEELKLTLQQELELNNFKFIIFGGESSKGLSKEVCNSQSLNLLIQSFINRDAFSKIIGLSSDPIFNPS